tara:strand:- start:378 stop:926 length:549 start_codon:yes stop_codon:yes gene_type:complete
MKKNYIYNRIVSLIIVMKLSLGIASGSIFELKATDIDGSVVPISNYKGKVLLIVNTASRCGFTPQYKSLESLYKKYRERNFVVLAFPSNDFRQELSSDEEIKNFCNAYELTFPIFAKGKVKGFEKQEVFKYLTEDSIGRSMGEIRWNFEKFLLSRDGKLIKRFRSSVDPNQNEIIMAIESLL